MERTMDQLMEARKKSEAIKEQYIKENQQEWIERGRDFKEWREEKDLKLDFVAWNLGVSRGRVKRFEDGEPVVDSELLTKAYDLFRSYWSLKGEMARALNKY